MLLSYEMLEESVVENCSQLINKLLGASGGLGLETTRILALRGVHVVMAVGNVKNGLSIKETLPKEIPNAKFDVFELDISSLASVMLMAARLMLSQNNIELQFATNHLGHFLLATLLLENY
ncbi:NADP-retinol dehydrogenase [Trifolium repens]|nr:NAD(P)-binding Rossmann-fold superfamily protein [Trifolium repens]KAK2411370.1 NAD(P)-binding Rossmann-fold superfamily protein [Trifolium repens]WJX31418.1 NADP-retinol dehydrogenase [Trifolium repens]